MKEAIEKICSIRRPVARPLVHSTPSIYRIYYMQLLLVRFDVGNKSTQYVRMRQQQMMDKIDIEEET